MKPLTVLVTPIDCVGHVNACAGAVKPLLNRGHRVIFLIEKSFQGNLSAQGYEEDVYDLQGDSEGNNAGEAWANELLANGVIGPNPLEEKFVAVVKVFQFSPRAMEVMRQSDGHIKAAIAKYSPDLIWMDSGYVWPAIYWSGVPWVLNMSLGPLLFMSAGCDEVPPCGSGYPTKSPRDDKWRNFKKLNGQFKSSKEFNDIVESCGYRRYPDDQLLPINDALLALYAFPEEYNHQAIRDQGWFNLEVFNKNCSKETIALEKLVPREFLNDTLNDNWSGKWVFLSLGSMASIDLSLMKKFMEAISETNHKFIVSKGPRHMEIELPENAWGDRYLPQILLVPQMDLVITHGGNNTVTETFAQGVPMIVCPMFGDQYDNAQRLHETGLGLRLDPYLFEKNQLIEAIDKLLFDDKLYAKLQAASDRILNNHKHEELANLVEELLAKRSKN